jgi:hypothetical protein
MGREDAVAPSQINPEQEQRALENVKTLTERLAGATQRQTAAAGERS